MFVGAGQVLRDAMPATIRPQFLGYNPAAPPPTAAPGPGEDGGAAPYTHTWAAYTAAGSRRRIEAARAQRRYREWQVSHPRQARAAESEVPCFDGRVPCAGPFHPGRAWFYDPANRTGLT